MASEAEASRMVARMKGFLAQPALLEPPFGPFDKADGAGLKAIADKTGKPEFFLAFMRARFEEPILYNVAFGEPARKAVFLRVLDTSFQRPIGTDSEEQKCSDATIVTKIQLALTRALDFFGMA